MRPGREAERLARRALYQRERLEAAGVELDVLAAVPDRERAVFLKRLKQGVPVQVLNADAKVQIEARRV